AFFQGVHAVTTNGGKQATLLGTSPSPAAQQCADVEAAKVALRSVGLSSGRGETTQAPRGEQGTRQTSQTQSPRGRTAEQQRAIRLVNEATAACGSGDTMVASQKAREAMSLLRK